MLSRMRVELLWTAMLGSLLAFPSLAQEVVADAGEDIELECLGDVSFVTLDGTGSSMGPDIGYLWSATGVDFDDPASLTPTGEFPPGATSVTLTVTSTDPDTQEVDEASDEVLVTVADGMPPMVKAAASPAVLWPPNHKLHRIEAEVLVHDACDPDPTVVLYRLESSVSDRGRGSGNTRDDIQDADLGTLDSEFMLRAEREGGGEGRVYTAIYRATDAAGNFSDAAVLIHTPHDMSQYKRALKSQRQADKAARKAIARATKLAQKAARRAFKEAKQAKKALAKAARRAAKASRAR